MDLEDSDPGDTDGTAPPHRCSPWCTCWIPLRQLRRNMLAEPPDLLPLRHARNPRDGIRVEGRSSHSHDCVGGASRPCASLYLGTGERLEGGPVVFGHVRGLESGSVTPLPVRLVLDADPEQVPPFWFEPRGSSPKTSSFER